MQTVATTLSLQAFLEDSIGFGSPVEVRSLLSQQPAPRQYSAAQGLITATVGGRIKEDRWVGMHLAEEPGTVLYDAMYERGHFLYTLHRVENYVQKQLAAHGLQLSGRLMADPTGVDRMLEAIQEFVRQRNGDAATRLQFHSSITLRRRQPELNWDVLMRFAFWNQDEDALIQYRIPSIVTEIERMITLLQGDHVRAAVTRLLQDFDSHGDVFQALPELDPAQVIVHHLISRPDALADTIYGAYKAAVQVALNLHWDGQDKERARALKAWEHLDRAYQVIWSGAVELARVQLNTFLAFNKAIATPG